MPPIYLYSEDWFDSMVRYSGGKTLGNTYKHLDTDPDFVPTENAIENLMRMEGKKDHYMLGL